MRVIDGKKLGDCDKSFAGNSEGAWLGNVEIARLGLLLATTVLVDEGVPVGSSDNMSDGLLDGVPTTFADGSCEGFAMNSSDGAELGISVRLLLRARVGKSLGLADVITSAVGTIDVVGSTVPGTVGALDGSEPAVDGVKEAWHSEHPLH